jgi:hypothetical protein
MIKLKNLLNEITVNKPSSLGLFKIPSYIFQLLEIIEKNIEGGDNFIEDEDSFVARTNIRDKNNVLVTIRNANELSELYEEPFEDDVFEVIIEPKDDVNNCNGISISNKDQSFWETITSGIYYREIHGIKYGGKPLYYDIIWC